MTVIAIIDDDNSLRGALHNLLSSHDLQPLPFASASEFLKADLGRDVDLLVTDIQMPGMSGLELIKWLRSHGSDVPIIAMTGHHTDGIKQQALDVGAFVCLFKPFDGNELVSTIRGGLARRPS